MKSLLTTIAFISLLSFSAAAVELVSASHRDTNSFKRISEFFSGDENPGRYTLLRTNPAEREGFYLSMKFTKEERANISSIRLRYIEPASHTEKITRFELAEAPKARLLLGLTDSQWLDPVSAPLAWRIETLDANGQILTHHQSFLWSPR